MDKYINADKFIRDLEDEYHGMISDESLKIYKIIQRLNDEPGANVVEVKHGEWVFSRKEWGSSDYSQDVYYKCSICGKEYEEFDIDEAKHCPECGAKMDGGDAE